MTDPMTGLHDEIGTLGVALARVRLGPARRLVDLRSRPA